MGFPTQIPEQFSLNSDLIILRQMNFIFRKLEGGGHY